MWRFKGLALTLIVIGLVDIFWIYQDKWWHYIGLIGYGAIGWAGSWIADHSSRNRC